VFFICIYAEIDRGQAYYKSEKKVEFQSNSTNIGDLTFALKRWNKNQQINIFHQIKQTQDSLLQIKLQLQSPPFDSRLLGLETGIHRSLTSLLSQEEVYWAQHVRLGRNDQ
jgi:hypothetical protein